MDFEDLDVPSFAITAGENVPALDLALPGEQVPDVSVSPPSVSLSSFCALSSRVFLLETEREHLRERVDELERLVNTWENRATLIEMEFVSLREGVSRANGICNTIYHIIMNYQREGRVVPQDEAIMRLQAYRRGIGRQ